MTDSIAADASVDPRSVRTLDPRRPTTLHDPHDFARCNLAREVANEVFLIRHGHAVDPSIRERTLERHAETRNLQICNGDAGAADAQGAMHDDRLVHRVLIEVENVEPA